MFSSEINVMFVFYFSVDHPHHDATLAGYRRQLDAGGAELGAFDDAIRVPRSVRRTLLRRRLYEPVSAAR